MYFQLYVNHSVKAWKIIRKQKLIILYYKKIKIVVLILNIIIENTIVLKKKHIFSKVNLLSLFFCSV